MSIDDMIATINVGPVSDGHLVDFANALARLEPSAFREAVRRLHRKASMFTQQTTLRRLARVPAFIEAVARASKHCS